MNKPNKEIPKAKDCIAYIESCGWTYDYYNRPWYVFKRNCPATTSLSPNSMSFTISELRDTFKYGW